MSAEQQVQQAVQALYGGSATSPEQQRAANAFLHEFASTQVPYTAGRCPAPTALAPCPACRLTPPRPRPPPARTPPSQEAWAVALSMLQAPSSDVQFFAANLLYTKVQREWTRVPAEDATRFSATLLAMLQRAAATAAPPQPPLFAPQVQRRICLALAAASVHNAASCDLYLREALAMAGGGGGPSTPVSVGVALDMLTVLPEERQNAGIPLGRKAELDAQLLRGSGHVLALLDHVGAPAASGLLERLPGGAGSVVLCLRNWIASLELPLSALHGAHPVAFGVLLRCFAAPPDMSVLQQAAEAIGACVGVLELPRPAARDGAVAALGEAVLGAAGLHAVAMKAGEEDAAHALVSVVCGLVSAEVDTLARGADAMSVALMEMVLRCAAHPCRRIAMLTFDNFLELQDLPLAARQPALRAPYFARLLAVLLAQSSLPPAFTTWEDNEEGSAGSDDLDEDEFRAFRASSQGVGDVAECAFELLREAFVEQLMGTVVDGATGAVAPWHAVEVALFMLTVVSKPIKRYLADVSAATAPSRERIGQMLFQLFGELASNAAWSTHRLSVAAACELFGAFAPWFEAPGNATASLPAPGPRALVRPVMAYLAKGLELPEARKAAAASLGKMCARCSGSLVADVGILDGVLAAFETAVGAGLEIGSRVVVVEGVSRVNAMLPAEQATALLERLVGGMLRRISACLAQLPTAGANQPVLLSQVRDDLQLLATVVRFMDDPVHKGPGGAHLALPLAESCYPVCVAVAGACRGDERVVQELFVVFEKMFHSFREGMEAKLQGIAELLYAVFQVTPAPAALNCLATAAEIFGSANQAAEDTFKTLFSLFTQASFAHLSKEGRHPAHNPDLLRAYFDAAFRFLLFCPAAVLTAAELPTIMELLATTITAQEFEPVRACLLWGQQLVVRQKVGAGGRLGGARGGGARGGGGGGGGGAAAQAFAEPRPYEENVVEVLRRGAGEAVVLAAVNGLASESPSKICGHLADLLHALVSTYPDATKPWIFNALGKQGGHCGGGGGSSSSSSSSSSSQCPPSACPFD